ncbi:MAG TPA: GH92 family glycosyl hydrolase [Bacteroidales bacterium]|nr:GH92 family glycosyl hydrolase [Bacteroidales bacterium]
MRPIFTTLLFLITISIFAQNDFSKYVNPFIGTGGHGHTYPGAQYPYGMMQLSPDTRKEGWDGCSGYHFSDSVILGFSHTHLSGTGVSDYSDLLIMPFADNAAEAYPTLSKVKTASQFSHKYEDASPGYYEVLLAENDINVALTATARCGMHKYVFNRSGKNKILIDLQYRDEVTYSKITFENDSTISGVRYSKAWATNQKFYFVIKLSQPVRHKFLYLNDTLQTGMKTAIGTNLKAVLFLPDTTSAFLMKVGISATGIEDAQKNLNLEIPDWNIKKVLNQATEAWNKELGRIEYSTNNQNDKIIFYSALYHCMIVPTVFTNVDNTYLGRDFEKHTAEGFDYYTVFSLWDTYRGYHPLMSVIDRKRTRDYVLTFLEQFNQVGLLPVWEFAANETFCMIGNHSIPVISSAIMNDIIVNPDTQKLLLNAMVETANTPRGGIGVYKEFGYIPSNRESESVSKTLEFAYDDWCIAQVARKLGDEQVYTEFIKRAQSYKNIFNPENGFHAPKANGTFLKPFDPKEVNFNYTEANGWQYNFYIPQDVSGYMDLLGDEKIFAAKLDSMFEADSQTTGRDQSDITGLIGQYAHGNEPSHHMAYLYAWTSQPWKTQLYCDSILQHLYFNAPDGLSGNEDCGQMSAWYVLSALGFYPVNPADGNFVFGSPQHNEASIHLENGKTFRIKTVGQSDKNKYIQQVTLNGIAYSKNYISYADILAGDELVFVMGPEHSSYGAKPEDRPNSEITDNKIQPLPYATLLNGIVFSKKNVMSLHSATGWQIEYRILPDGEWKKYKKPLRIKKTTLVEYRNAGEVETDMTQAIKKNIHLKVELFQPYNSQYTAGGPSGLVDGQRGGEDFRTGGWQGYEGTDFTAVIDLGKKQMVRRITLGCLQEARSWIWMPTSVEYYYSVDGVNYIKLGSLGHNVPDTDLGAYVMDFPLDFVPVEARYIKVFAKNYGVCPDWHLGKGGKAWIFVDEIIVE